MTWWISSKATAEQIDGIRRLLDGRAVSHRDADRVLGIMGIVPYPQHNNELMDALQRDAIDAALDDITAGQADSILQVLEQSCHLSHGLPSQTVTAKMLRKWTSLNNSER